MFENGTLTFLFLPARAPWFAEVILKVELLGGILHKVSVWILFEIQNLSFEWNLNKKYLST